MTAPTVVLVDDHPVFRHGLAGLLEEEDVRVVAQAGTAADGVAAAARWLPDVVVMDLHLPDRSGVAATRDVLATAPRTRVLVLTMDSADPTVVAVLRAGARGYLLKESAAEGIGPALRAVLAGELVLDPRVGARIPALLATAPRGDGPFAGLTARERQIAELVAEGRTNAEIGRALLLAEKTVRNTLSAVLAKTGASDRSVLRALADQEKFRGSGGSG